MDYKDTNLFFLEKDCITEFGIEKGMKIYNESKQRMNTMLAEADFRNSKAVEDHMKNNMYPALAYYITLLDHEFSKEAAYEYTLKETQKSAQSKKKKTEKLKRIPFVYTVFRLFAKTFMKKNFPKEGWETEWVRCDKKEVHFNLSRCVYYDIMKENNCPELCTVFCKNDDTVFAGYEPKINFFRSGTLAEGACCCDFHFKRG